MKRSLTLAAGLAISFGAVVDRAMAEETAAHALSSMLSGYQSYQADFSQQVMDAQGRTVQEARGVMKAKRPGLFYWESQAPMAQFVTSDGEQVTVYDPDLMQVTIHSVDDRVASTPAMLISGDVSDLSSNYDVSGRDIGSDAREYTLVPLGDDSLFLSLTMTFAGDKLEAMRLEDSLGQKTLLTFRDIQLNEPVPSSAFKLNIPADVDVVGDAS